VLWPGLSHAPSLAPEEASLLAPATGERQLRERVEDLERDLAQVVDLAEALGACEHAATTNNAFRKLRDRVAASTQQFGSRGFLNADGEAVRLGGPDGAVTRWLRSCLLKKDRGIVRVKGQSYLAFLRGASDEDVAPLDALNLPVNPYRFQTVEKCVGGPLGQDFEITLTRETADALLVLEYRRRRHAPARYEIDLVRHKVYRTGPPRVAIQIGDADENVKVSLFMSGRTRLSFHDSESWVLAELYVQPGDAKAAMTRVRIEGRKGKDLWLPMAILGLRARDRALFPDVRDPGYGAVRDLRPTFDDLWANMSPKPVTED
jgi:hypothetical protein